MKNKTIAEMRKSSLEKFNEDYIHDIDTARKIVNIYYRLVALEVRNLELDTERNQGARWYIAECEKEKKQYERLSNLLKPYGLELHTAWIKSSIVKQVNEFGGVKEVFTPYFY